MLTVIGIYPFPDLVQSACSSLRWNKVQDNSRRYLSVPQNDPVHQQASAS